MYGVSTKTLRSLNIVENKDRENVPLIGQKSLLNVVKLNKRLILG